MGLDVQCCIFGEEFQPVSPSEGTASANDSELVSDMAALSAVTEAIANTATESPVDQDPATGNGADDPGRLGLCQH